MPIGHASLGTRELSIGITDHTLLTNIGVNTHVQIDTHIANSGIHFTEASIDHGSIGGLSGDDHTQYALLAGRLNSQTLNGGIALAGTLILRGSSHFTLGQINVESPIEFFQVEAEGLNPSYNIKIRDDYTTSTGVVVQGTIQSTRELDIATGIWFVSQIQDSGIYNQTITPGFSAFTLFNAFPVISTGGPTIAAALIGSITTQAAIIHENDSDGAGIGTFGDTALSFRPGVRALTAGDTVFVTDATGLRVFPQIYALNAAATVTFTTIRGVWIQEPLTTGHIGTGIISNYIGLDMVDIVFGTGTKVALRSALSAATNNFCIQHTGTAQSLFGGDVEIDGDLNHDGTNIGFFGTTPANQGGATEDIKDWLQSVFGGLSGATPLNLDDGALTAGDLENTGGRTKATTRVTTTYTILVSDYVIFGNTDSAAFTATLPAGAQGRTFKVINSGSSGNALTLAPDGSDDLIGANSNFTLLDGETLDITYDTTDGWY